MNEESQAQKHFVEILVQPRNRLCQEVRGFEESYYSLVQRAKPALPWLAEPDLTIDPNRPLIRDSANKLVSRGYWMDMNYRTLVMGADLLVFLQWRESTVLRKDQNGD
jgi:hypothetical protein